MQVTKAVTVILCLMGYHRIFYKLWFKNRRVNEKESLRNSVCFKEDLALIRLFLYL